jgi:hypothetical protein
MKANARISAIDTASSAEIARQVTSIESKIAQTEIEHEALQEQLPRLIAEHQGTELAAVKERRQLRELTELLDELRRDRQVFQTQLDVARQREQQEAFEDAKRTSQRMADEVILEAEAIQADVVRLVGRVRLFRERLAAFDTALPGNDPGDFQRGTLSVGLMRRLEMALYVESNGALRPLKILETPYEAKQAGRGNLKRDAIEYTGVGLRGRTPRRLMNGAA